MATILAANTGNWSATGTWTGGVIPVAGDVVVANGKTVTIDTLNVTVAELRNDTTGGAVAGGSFNLVSGGNVNANVYAGSSATSCVNWNGTTGQTATLTGNIYAGTVNSAGGISCGSSGNLTIGGGSSIYGAASTATAVGLTWSSTGTLVVGTSGNPCSIYGSSFVNSSSWGLSATSTNSSITIYANIITSTVTGTAAGAYIAGTNNLLTVVASTINSVGSASSGISIGGILNPASSVTVSGSIYGSNGQQNNAGIYLATNTTLNIVCSGSFIPQSANNGCAVINGSTTGTMNITGNATGSNSIGFAAIGNASTGTLNFIGTLTAGNTSAGGSNSAAGIFRATRIKGNGYGAGSAGINNFGALVGGTQSSLNYVEEIEFGSLGATPMGGPVRFTNVTNNKVIFTTTTGSFKTLVDTAATSGILPNASDVRSGVTYNSGNTVGTCAVPTAASVALNVPIGNTVGTAFLNASDIRPGIGLSAANLDSQLAAIPGAAQNAGATRTELIPELNRVNNCATVDTTSQQIQNAFP